MKVILSHAGKQHSYYIAKSLYQLGLLKQFYTSSYINSGLLQDLVKKSGNTFWSRRFLEGLPPALVTSNWRFEIKELVYAKLHGKGVKTLNAVYERDEKFDSYMSKKISGITADVFWGFQGSSLQSLKAANSKGMASICELSTGHVIEAVKLLGEEAQLHPEWADSFDNLTFPSHYMKRLEEEPHVARYVIAASEFTKKTLKKAGVSAHKIFNLPLGFDLQKVPYDLNSFSAGSNRPLRLLYAGRITQRKGIAYMLEAMKAFNKRHVELHMIGFVHGSGQGLKPYKGLYHLHPAISQEQLFRQYSQFDALILPSLFEGFGLVIIEALAAGLPVITTPNTIGADVIKNDVNGYLVPIRDVGAIEKAITSLCSKSTDELLQMRVSARESALNMSWSTYGKRLKDFIDNINIGA